MELIEWILKDENLKAAIRAVKGNKGAAGIDKMPVEELDGYFAEHGEEIKEQIRAKKYKPQPTFPRPTGNSGLWAFPRWWTE